MAADPSLEGLVPFLLEAKRWTYAALGEGAATVPAALDGAKQLEYARHGWLYRDVYWGGDYFAGQEVVYVAGRARWSMVYAGGLVVPEVLGGTEALYAFLRCALRQVTAERPFRGPRLLTEGPLAYRDEGEGDVGAFWGIEEMTLEGRVVYVLRYQGGLLRPA